MASVRFSVKSLNPLLFPSSSPCSLWVCFFLCPLLPAMLTSCLWFVFHVWQSTPPSPPSACDCYASGVPGAQALKGRAEKQPEQLHIYTDTAKSSGHTVMPRPGLLWLACPLLLASLNAMRHESSRLILRPAKGGRLLQLLIWLLVPSVERSPRREHPSAKWLSSVNMKQTSLFLMFYMCVPYFQMPWWNHIWKHFALNITRRVGGGGRGRHQSKQ